MSQPIGAPPPPTRRRGWLVAGLGVFVVLVLIGLAVFQPWKLFIDKKVDEALPAGAQAAAPAAGDPSPTTSSRRPTSREPSSTGATETTTTTQAATPPGGTFQSYEHQTTGRVRVVRADGKTFVRLEDFATSNGPDVVVYLSPAPPSGPESAFGQGPVNLGSLKGNVGNQNYEVPVGTDLSQYQSVVIWCQRFSVAFGAASL